MGRGGDGLDKTVLFLNRRDGIDKVIKIARYAAKLVLATSPAEPGNAELLKSLGAVEATLGTSRKVYRMGKFLQNLRAMRQVPLRAPYASLELLANAGECLYYFLDQFQWCARRATASGHLSSTALPPPIAAQSHRLTSPRSPAAARRLVRSGVLPAAAGPRLTQLSASGELVGYAASITLAVLRLHNLLEREVALIAELQRRRSLRAAAGADPEDDKDAALVGEIRGLRARRALRTLGLAQDLADALLALADLRDAKEGVLSHRGLLAACGLLSGCISAYKNWPGVVK
jgi:hypothetical protein